MKFVGTMVCTKCGKTMNYYGKNKLPDTEYDTCVWCKKSTLHIKREMKEEQENQPRYSAAQWNRQGLNYFPLEELNLNPHLPAGLYTIRFFEGKGPGWVQHFLKTNETIDISSPDIDLVIKESTEFFKSKEKFEKYGLIHKRGILIYGKTGGGKTTLVKRLIDHVINVLDGVVIKLDYHSAGLFQGTAGLFAQLEKERPVLIVIEDIETITQYSDGEQIILQILDGYIEKDNIIFLATTNHTEKLHERLVSRPSRFDLRIKVGYPTREQRAQYFKSKISGDDLEQFDEQRWLDDSESFSFAHLEEMIKAVFVFGRPYDEMVAYLKSLSEIPQSSDYEKEKKKIGFGSKNTGTERAVYNSNGTKQVKLD